MKDKRVMIGLSGGINSMAVLCWLIEQEDKPKDIWLFYAHFEEHSPDTMQFVQAGIEYAKKHFENVHVLITQNSVLEFFKVENMIPHPAYSPCSIHLKIEVANNWAFENNIQVDLVGYVKHELKRRAGRQDKTKDRGLFALDKQYPIGSFTDDWCFEIVDRHIGWHPAIYDLFWTEEDFTEGICEKSDIGKRVFKHNNCMPCKNMYPKDIKAIKKYYPPYYVSAMQLSSELSKFWGRDKDEFYMTFGRDLGQEVTCEVCKF